MAVCFGLYGQGLSSHLFQALTDYTEGLGQDDRYCVSSKSDRECDFKMNFRCVKGCNNEIRAPRKNYLPWLFGDVLVSTLWIFSSSGRSPTNRGVGKEVCVHTGRDNREEGRASRPRIDDRRCGSRVEIQGTE